MAGIENLIEELLLKKGEVDSGVRSIYLLFVARWPSNHEMFLPLCRINPTLCEQRPSQLSKPGLPQRSILSTVSPWQVLLHHHFPISSLQSHFNLWLFLSWMAIVFCLFFSKLTCSLFVFPLATFNTCVRLRSSRCNLMEVSSWVLIHAHRRVPMWPIVSVIN